MGTQLFAQLVSKTEKVRLGIGIAGFGSKQIDQMIDRIEEETARIGPGVKVNPFNENLTYFFEYQSELGEGFSYQLNLQYSSGKTSSSNQDIRNLINQGLLFEYNIYEFSIDLVYYLPVFMISTSQTSLVIGAGPDFNYVETLSVYFFDQEPAFAQSIRNKRNGGLIGARAFAGWNIPYVESLSLQFRVGYTYRPKTQLPTQTEELLVNNTAFEKDKMDSEYFKSFDIYDLSQYWITFSVAYRF